MIPLPSASERHHGEEGQEKGQEKADLRAVIESWPGIDDTTRMRLLELLGDHE